MPLDRPIPAFYCCYLLRSTVRPSNLYIGSTPNPVRRTKQHNGITLGGAARTSRDNLRPWEMTCIVTGFPSPVSALQFEWAWQNPHLTLHIPAELRITSAKSKKRSGRPKRPKHTVSSLLANLHLLLRVPSFSRWPLELRFFSSDVHKVWTRSVAEASQEIRDTIPIHIDLPQPPKAESDITGDLGLATQAAASVKRSATPLTGHGIERLSVDYASQKPHVEKSKAIFDFEREGSCAVCKKDLEHQGGIYALCPNHSCEAVSHLTCLSRHFLANETSADEASNPVVPIEGNCPVCTSRIRWTDVVKEVTLRMRGQKEVEKLLKKPRVKKPVKKTKKQLSAEAEAFLTETEDAGLSDEDLEDMEVADESLIFGGQAISAASPDDWVMSDSSDSDSNSIMNGAAHRSHHKRAERSMPTEIVIKDSEDDVEISD